MDAAADELVLHPDKVEYPGPRIDPAGDEEALDRLRARAPEVELEGTAGVGLEVLGNGIDWIASRWPREEQN
jgi:hypothetical protein